MLTADRRGDTYTTLSQTLAIALMADGVDATPLFGPEISVRKESWRGVT